MNDNIKFWYPVKTEGQLTFDGHTHFRDVIAGEGHIVYMEILLCRQSREKLKYETGAKKHKSISSRIEGTRLCPVCEKKYKANQSFAWQRWVVSAREVSAAARALEKNKE